MKASSVVVSCLLWHLFSVPVSVAQSAGPVDSGCQFGKPESVLTLPEAVRRTLCYSPKARAAWASIQEKAADLSLSKMAYLPSVSGTASEGMSTNRSSSADDPLFDAHTRYRHPKAELDMTLTLFDFNFRSATTRSAKDALSSAYALHEDVLREAFLQSAQAYFAVLKASSAEQSDRELEDDAKRIRDAVTGRFQGGAALLTEQLQAESSLSQLTLKRIAAEGDVETAKASLAAFMGLDVDVAFAVGGDSSQYADATDFEDIHELIHDALGADAKILAAAADVRSAEADVSVERARDLPKISLEADSAFNTQTYYGRNEFSIYQNDASNTQHSNEISLQIKIPLTDWVYRRYKVKSAEANVAAKQADLDSTKQQVAVDVWNAFQKLKVSDRSLGVSRRMVGTATQLYTVCQGRYFAGAGALVDVLNAQRDLESARQGELNATFDLQLARLALLSTLGRLSPSGIGQ